MLESYINYTSKCWTNENEKVIKMIKIDDNVYLKNLKLKTKFT